MKRKFSRENCRLLDQQRSNCEMSGNQCEEIEKRKSISALKKLKLSSRLQKVDLNAEGFQVGSVVWSDRGFPFWPLVQLWESLRRSHRYHDKE